MKIHHVALWTDDLERLVAFWRTRFGAEAGAPYVSRNQPGFVSVGLRLEDGPFLELMTHAELASRPAGRPVGYAHIALSLGSEAAVDATARDAAGAGELVSGPRWTGDGFYEAVLKDPDGNLVEITP